MQLSLTALVPGVLAVLTAVTLSACKVDDDPPRTEAEFCTEYAQRECATVGTWCALTTLDTCRTARAAACQQRVQAWKAEARPYDASRTDACLEKLGATYAALPISPDNLRALDDSCARIFQGKVKVNQPCMVDYDCEGEMICDPARKKCGAKRVVTSGAGCANVGEICPTGETCKLVNDVQLCQPRLAMGMACWALDPCLETLRCADTCQARLPLSAPCTSNDQCTTNYCEPYAMVCATGLLFAPGSASCTAFGAGS